MSKLYHDRIKELASKGKGGKLLEQPDSSAYRKNPMCGDEVTVSVRKNAAKGIDVGYEARGCLICLAACAKMEEIVDGTSDFASLEGSIGKVLEMFDLEVPDEMEEFAPVSKHRSRHECVLLPFKALNELMSK